MYLLNLVFDGKYNLRESKESFVGGSDNIFDALFATTICVIYSVNTFQICHDHIDSTMQ